MLAVGFRDGRFGVYDTATGGPLFEPFLVDEFPCCIAGLAWNSDDSRLHVGGQDGTLRTFETATWKQVSEHPLTRNSAIRSARLSDDGIQIILPLESGEVFLIDPVTGESIGELFIAAGTQLQRAILVRDGTVLAAQGRDGKLRLWDVATHRPIGPALAGHSGFSLSLEPGIDGTVISGGTDGSVIRWNMAPRSWVDSACELASRNLTRDEWAAYVGGAYEQTCAQWPASDLEG
jgi:WD40 repeat protein